MFKELTDNALYDGYKNVMERDFRAASCILVPEEYNSEETHRNAVLFLMKKILKEQEKKFGRHDSMDEGELEKIGEIEPKKFLKNSDPYTRFLRHTLFPNGNENLEIFEWNTDWSNYFADEDMHPSCTSIYDKSLNRLIVIFTPNTD